MNAEVTDLGVDRPLYGEKHENMSECANVSAENSWFLA
jgi:hypothetical protein